MAAKRTSRVRLPCAAHQLERLVGADVAENRESRQASLGIVGIPDRNQRVFGPAAYLPQPVAGNLPHAIVRYSRGQCGGRAGVLRCGKGFDDEFLVDGVPRVVQHLHQRRHGPRVLQFGQGLKHRLFVAVTPVIQQLQEHRHAEFPGPFHQALHGLLLVVGLVVLGHCFERASDLLLRLRRGGRRIGLQQGVDGLRAIRTIVGQHAVGQLVEVGRIARIGAFSLPLARGLLFGPLLFVRDTLLAKRLESGIPIRPGIAPGSSRSRTGRPRSVGGLDLSGHRLPILRQVRHIERLAGRMARNRDREDNELEDYPA